MEEAYEKPIINVDEFKTTNIITTSAEGVATTAAPETTTKYIEPATDADGWITKWY